MILDANTGLPAPSLSCDTCIVGSGPAGISLALKLAKAGRRCVLLEAGGREFSWVSQELYDGDILGLDYHPLDAPRLRYFGGTTGHWTGRCMMFDPEDFLPRPDIPLSGWPITHLDLAPYQAEAERLFNITPFGDLRHPADDTGAIEIVAQRLSSHRGILELKNNEPVRFGHVYASELATQAGLEVILNANMTAMTPDPITGRIAEVTFRNYAGDEGTVAAQDFVLAMGGIENARFLLLLNEAHNQQFGNLGGMVGRCFMDHPEVNHGTYFITRRLYSHSPYWEAERLVMRAIPELLLSTSAARARADGHLSGTLHLDRMRRRSLPSATEDDAPFIRGLTFDEDYFFVGNCWSMTEQAPNPSSRVLLSARRDRFGLPRAAVDWQLLPIDFATLRGTTLNAAQYLVRSGLGRMQINRELWEGDVDVPLIPGSHHMGTTRMSTTPSTGVVNSDCRVHGSQNLFIAGSSVFPTSSHATPTFTIVQLALRLADHLLQRPV